MGTNGSKGTAIRCCACAGAGTKRERCCRCPADEVNWAEIAASLRDTLILRGRGIVTIPPAFLSQCVLLRVLEAPNNALAQLPASFASLHSLERLDLSGNVLEQLPASLGMLTSLTSLDLSGNRLVELPAGIGGCRRLSRLHADRNRLASVPEGIGDLVDLERLHLEHNVLKALPDSIQHLTNLAALTLSHNQLEMLPADLGSLRSLRRLYADHNCLATVPNSMALMRSLRVLHLTHNRLTSLPPEVSMGLQSLETLGLGGNTVRVLHAHMPGSLRSLGLAGNRLAVFNGEDCLAGLTSLVSLDLRCVLAALRRLRCGLARRGRRLGSLPARAASNNDIGSLPWSLGQVVTLQSLHLRHNRLAELPESLFALPRLTDLDLQDNQLGELSPHFDRLAASLRRLNLADNPISVLPPAFGRLTTLHSLNLGNTALRQLPDWFVSGNLSSPSLRYVGTLARTRRLLLLRPLLLRLFRQRWLTLVRGVAWQELRDGP